MRVRRVALIVAVLLFVPSVVSVYRAQSATHDTPFSITFVEWLRDNGAVGVVNKVESIYYSWTAPSKGGPGIKSLPHQPGQVIAAAKARAKAQEKAAAAYLPPPITPILHPALPGEGVWRATFTGVHGPPPVLVTSFRNDTEYPSNVAGVAWINQSATNVWLYPGAQEPSVQMNERGPEEVPMTVRSKLVATFNSAFKLADSDGGFVYRGHTYAPMHDGLGTAVRYTDGTVGVIDWTYGPTAPPDIVYARQNLPLIVENGQLNPTLNDTSLEWGATLGNAILVWRSALGVDSHGNLLYATANDLTVTALAKIMQHAGAVRAMEMDINAYWPSFITYTGPGAAGATNLLPDMNRSPQRYLTPDDRDFFAVYLR